MEKGTRRRPPVTAIVTTFNEEHNIARCLEALQWCDDLLVVDSFSTDRTPEICRSFPGVRFVQRTYLGASAQKNWAIAQARHDWLLIFDADEVCTDPLREEIENLLSAGPKHDTYTIGRSVYFLGEVIRFSGWQHDRVVRLVRRGSGEFQKRRVHAAWAGPAGPMLNNSMDHHMVRELRPYITRLATYGWWGAAQEWRDGTRSSLRTIMAHVFYRFFRTYVLQGGVLDGTRGLVFCLLQSYQTYIKWSLLWSWHVNSARGIPPELPRFEDDDENDQTPGTFDESVNRTASGEQPSLSGRPTAPNPRLTTNSVPPVRKRP